MDSALKVISTIIEKFKLKELILAVLIVCCVILFVPTDFISILGLERWRDEHRSIIGLILLFCAVCCLIWLFSCLKSRFWSFERQAQKVSREYLKKMISSHEQDFLIQNFFDFERNEFKPTARLDMTSGYIAPLENAYIITRASNMGRLNYWAYDIQPNVRLYLNKAVKEGKIVITQQGYRWLL